MQTTSMLAHPSGVLTPGDIVQAVKHLPSAPRVLPKIKRLLTDCNSSIDEIVALIRMDPAIAAQVVRVGNSAYYSSGTSCATVEEAVGRVGFNQVYELVSYAVAAQVLIRPLAAYGLEADEVWKQSMACALSAETLAKHVGQDSSNAYTVGLLHAIGMVAIDEWALRTRRTIALAPDPAGGTSRAKERAILGFTHAEAGAALLKHWGFPPTVYSAVHWQEAPTAGERGGMAALLHTAKFIGTAACAPKTTPSDPDAAVLALLPLAANSLPSITAEVVLRLEEVSPLLEIETLTNSVHVSDKLRFPSDNFSG